MKTASWFKYSGEGRIGISRGTPRNVQPGYRVYRKLMPGRWFNSVDVATYDQRYRAEVLAQLNPQRVWDELHALVAPHEPVLLCFEAPPFSADNWCHRRTLVVPWLEEALGVTITEYGGEKHEP